MAKFSAIAALLFVVGLLANLAVGQSVFDALQLVGLFGLACSALYYAYRLLRFFLRPFLWRVRNKIILSYAIVGLLPMAILALIGWIIFRLLFGQVSALYLEQELDRIGERLELASEQAALEFYASPERSAERLTELVKGRRLRGLAEDETLRHLRAGVFVREAQGYRPLGLFPEGTSLTLHRWSVSGFHGLVHDGSRLHFRSTQPVATNAGPIFVVLDLPFDQVIVDDIQARTSISLQPPATVDPEAAATGVSDVLRGGSSFGVIRWMHNVVPVEWESGRRLRSLGPESSLFAIAVPIDSLYYNFYFSQEQVLGQSLIRVILALAVVFVVVVALSFFIGIAIARTITRSVRNISRGTERIRRGDFDYRIPSTGRDQLGVLADAFNDMSGSIRGLMSQLTEKERMEQELEIAREVQHRLFPRTIPDVPGIELSALCLPARSVSGDYYDFIPYGDDRIDIIIGDISGKGISAALLMAGLQSSVRTHIIYQSASPQKYGGIRHAVAAINGHLFSQTAADKFATLVFSRYVVGKRRLTYCNAGHNPPLMVSDGEVTRLGMGGMAAGLFADRVYEEETLQLKPGDLVVYYTDGVVEAEDESGEQFEEARLEDLILRNHFLTADDIQKLIMDEVMAFSGGGPQRDDITVVVLKAV